MSILTPKQIATVHIAEPSSRTDRDVLDTLAAYAEVVQKVAEMSEGRANWDEDSCVFCGSYPPLLPHHSTCPFVKAKALRGLA